MSDWSTYLVEKLKVQFRILHNFTFSPTDIFNEWNDICFNEASSNTTLSLKILRASPNNHDRQHPTPSNPNKVHPTLKQAVEFCSMTADCAALSLSSDNSDLRIFSRISSESIKPYENWTTILNQKRNNINNPNDDFDLELCCPFEVSMHK